MRETLQKALYQTDRYFHVLGKGWYFEAREGLMGPYPTHIRAHLALLRLIEEHPNRRSLNQHSKAA